MYVKNKTEYLRVSYNILTREMVDRFEVGISNFSVPNSIIAIKLSNKLTKILF